MLCEDTRVSAKLLGLCGLHRPLLAYHEHNAARVRPQIIERLGAGESVAVITDKFSGRSKGFGFVEMASDAEAQKATAALNGTDFEGRNIVVSEARPQAPRPMGAGTGGGGRPPRRDRF